MGLSAAHLAEPLDTGLDVWNQARRLASTDPVRASVVYEVAAGLLAEVAERAQLGNTVVEHVQGPLAQRGDALTQRLRQFQFARVDLDRLSFDPKEELDLAKSRAVRVVELVDQAREVVAKDALDALKADVDALATRMDVVAEAREGVPQRIDKLTERSKALKGELLQRRYALRLLTPANNGEAFQHESNLLGKYHARINHLTKLLARPQEHFDQGRYYLASKAVGAIEALFDAARALVDELADIEQKVEHARAQCRELIDVCQPQLRELQALMKQGGVDPAMNPLVAEQAVSFQMLRDGVGAEQVNWLRARDELQVLLDLVAFLRAEADADLNSPGGLSEATRAYREARVEAMASQMGSPHFVTSTTLGISSSWADSVATLDEAAQI